MDRLTPQKIKIAKDFLRELEEEKMRITPEQTKKIMQLISEEMGLEFGEEFYVEDPSHRAKFEKQGLFLEFDGDFVLNRAEIGDILSGDASWHKIPWEPEMGEVFFWPELIFDDPVSFCERTAGLSVYENIKKRVGVYKTYEEALAKAKELGWVE